MSRFKDLDLRVHYDTDCDDVVNEFYIPVLKESVTYKRAVAFFTSSSLIEVVEGLENIVAKNGHVELLISPKIEAGDIEAIEKGYKTRESVLENFVINELEIGETALKDKYNLLAWLISKKILDLKIVYRVDQVSGIFHDKLGLLYDLEEQAICFHGSNNETYSAMNKNYEAFDVFISWDLRDFERIKEKEKQFDRLWNNKSSVWKSFYLSDSLKNKILSYKYEEDPYEIEDMDEVPIEVELSNIGPSLPKWLELRAYQIDAMNRWFKSGGKGIFEMATGTGKTITSIAVITKLLNHYYQKDIPIALIVVLPYKVLLEQWEKELANFNINVLKCYDSKPTWEHKLDQQISLFNGGDQKNINLVTTNVTFKSDHFQERIRRLKHDYVLCIDEMHNFTSEDSLNSLPEGAKYRLGLSATLDNQYKSEQLERLKAYFGEGVIYRFSLEDAIRNDFLTKYYYYPVFVELTDFEKREYYEISKKISKMIGKVDIESAGLQSLFMARARLVSSAENKIEKILDFKAILKDSYNNLFYCGDRIEEDEKFIEKVNKALSTQIGIKTHTFTSQESKKDRQSILKDFKEGRLQALTAIRCLDEGVDIPGLRRAFILSSGSNPKEFIQRRGRVLRKAEGKQFAEIYDFIVVPTLNPNELKVMDLETLKNEKKILLKELNRFKEFADLSENPHEAYSEIFKAIELYK